MKIRSFFTVVIIIGLCFVSRPLMAQVYRLDADLGAVSATGITMVTQVQLSPGNLMQGIDQFVLAGHMASDHDFPSLLALSWEGDYSGWFHEWKLRLRAQPGILAEHLVDGTDVLEDRPGEFIDLLEMRPDPHRVYETTLSYAPADQLVSVQLIDMSSGQQLLAASFELAENPSPALGSLGARRLLSDEVSNTWGMEVVSAKSEDGFKRFGPPWTLMKERVMSYSDTGGEVTINWPNDSLPGALEVVLESGHEETLLHRLDWDEEPIVFSVSDRLPFGESTIKVYYVDEGNRYVVGERKLSRYRGRLFVNFGPLLWDEGQWRGLLNVRGDRPLEQPISVSVSLIHGSEVLDKDVVVVSVSDDERVTAEIAFDTADVSGSYRLQAEVVDVDGIQVIPQGRERWTRSRQVDREPIDSDGPRLVVYDLNNHQGLNPYEHVLLVTALQGLVNRDEPRLYVRYVHERSGGRRNVDDYWLEKLRADGEWLADMVIEPIDDLLVLLNRFADQVDGVAAWDYSVPATMNAATTAAGVENLLPIPWSREVDSLWQHMVEHGPRLPVQRWLVEPGGESLFTGEGVIPETEIMSTGSAKADVYVWAMEIFLKTGQVHSKLLGYFLDAYYLQSSLGAEWSHALSNRDYLIANRAFVFDLSPWGDEAPNDDPHQPIGTDYRVLIDILSEANERARGEMIKVVGFVPWNWKYTSFDGHGKHDPVPAEWEFIKIASAFNAYLEADAHDKSGIGAMANASVYAHYPLAPHYPQNPKPTVEDLIERGYLTADLEVEPKFYIAFYVGDYDSPAWLYHSMPAIWDDPDRGSIPLNWAFNPNLADRMAPAMVYTRQTRTEHDFFVSGDNGAGYLNPGMLREPRSISHLPSGWPAWIAHNKAYFEQWDLSATGFLIDGSARWTQPSEVAYYRQFSPDGIVFQYRIGPSIMEETPTLHLTGSWDPSATVEEAVNAVVGRVRIDSRYAPQFYVFRTILKTPGWHKQVVDGVRERLGDDVIEVVDYYTLFELLRLSRR